MNRAKGPIGYFVHHQGRGHAERAAAFAHALPDGRNMTLFCARDDIFPDLPGNAQIETIPSLFESDGQRFPALENADTPDNFHCTPLGWQSITQATGAIMRWFAQNDPALFITDVSAELGQLARIASVPHMAVLQHGDRSDAGHISAYRSAVGLLAPYSETLEQSDRPAWMRQKTIYAGGIGVDCSRLSDQAVAREKLGLAQDTPIVAVLGGGGGTGLPSAPLTLGARDEPDSEWITLGKIQSEWHETPPPNLQHLGWVDNPEDWISAADRIVSSGGNTTVHMVAAARKPWIVVPEWRYFSEQICKAEALDAAGVAAMARQWPSSVHEWRRLWHAAEAIDPEEQGSIVSPNAAEHAAQEVERLTERIWAETTVRSFARKAVIA